jgi:hypothetical protein
VAPYQEQKKIAKILSIWDQAIRLQEELIQEKEERRKAAKKRQAEEAAQTASAASRSPPAKRRKESDTSKVTKVEDRIASGSEVRDGANTNRDDSDEEDFFDLLESGQHAKLKEFETQVVEEQEEEEKAEEEEESTEESEASEEEMETDEKKLKSEERRAASVNQRNELFEAQKSLVAKALKAVSVAPTCSC